MCKNRAHYRSLCKHSQSVQLYGLGQVLRGIFEIVLLIILVNVGDERRLLCAYLVWAFRKAY